MKILVLTNLFPDARRPIHGIFIQRWLDAIKAATDWEFDILAPRPVSMPFFGSLCKPPLEPMLLPPEKVEVSTGTAFYPRFHHLPGIGVWRQWKAVYKACMPFVRQLANTKKYHAVLGVYLYPDGVAAAQIARWLGCPLVLSVRGTDGLVISRQTWLRQPIRKALRRAQILHAVSSELASTIEEVGKLASGSVVMLPNGVDTNLFKPGIGGSIRTELGLDAVSNLILAVGRLDPNKGHADLIETLPMLPEHFHLLIVGEGKLADPLRRLAEKKSVSARVHLLGRKSPQALAELYQTSDVFVLPSRREGCPNVLLEAVASGLPVVATNVGQVPMILQDEKLGIVIKETGPKGIAIAINKVINRDLDPDITDEFRRQWSWENRAIEFSGIMRRDLGWA